MVFAARERDRVLSNQLHSSLAPPGLEALGPLYMAAVPWNVDGHSEIEVAPATFIAAIFQAV